MRIIAGSAKGKKLVAPSGLDTRPITDMIKEALFNVLSVGIVQSRFLDLFAGSGSVGVEALSRGASRAIFVDKSSKAVQAIRDNLDHCNLKPNAEVFCMDVFKAIQYYDRHGEKFDYIYVDPTFTNEGIFKQFMADIDNTSILSSDGRLIIRTRRKKQMPDELKTLRKYRLNDYGESTLHYYCIAEEVPDK